MPVTNAEKKRFRTIGQRLNPVLIIAQKGVTDSIRQEIERALSDHELIKVKLLVPDRQAKRALTDSLCEEFAAECVHRVGHVILLYRAAAKPNASLSNLVRTLD